jgi:1,4-alpha-glucan branching enzyme
MVALPGKSLLFQGGDVGQWAEWSCKEEMHWYLLEERVHRGLHDMIRDLNHFYQHNSPLWKHDHTWEGFEIVAVSDADNGVLSYLRKDGQKVLLVTHQFTPNDHPQYYLPLQNLRTIKEVFNTDHIRYGGSKNEHYTPFIVHEGNRAVGVKVHMPPLATVIYEVEFYY